MKAKKKRWLRILCRWSVAAIFVVGLAAVAVKYWITPVMAYRGLREACLRHWDGSLQVRQIDFSLLDSKDTSVRLRNVQLLDRQGRLHASAAIVKLIFKEFPAMHPVLTDVAVEGLKLRLHRAEGKFILPFRRPVEPSEGQFVDLHSVEIPVASLTVYDDGVPGRRIEPLRFAVARKETSYVIRLQTPVAKPTQVISFVGRLPLDASGPALEELTGRGLLLLGDVNARGDPVTREFFAFLDGAAGRIATSSNIEAVFTLRGPLVTLQRGVLTDKLIVMQVEKGGTINLQTRRLDLYLITLQLRGVSELLAHIPVVRLATSLSNKLTRVHVTGTWDDKKFRKEHVKDLSAATLELLQDAIRTGGSLGPGVHGAFHQLFETLSTFRSKSKPAETKPTTGQ